MTLAFLIPAAPAMAQAEPPVLDAACQTVEPKVFKDIPALVTIDPDTAAVADLRLQAYRILDEATVEGLPVLSRELRERLGGTSDDLRAFLATDLPKAWSIDLRISVTRTLTDAGTNVKAAARKVLGQETVDAYLAYLNDGQYAARALDCAAQPTPSQPTPSQPAPSQSAPSTPAESAPAPSVTPSASTSAAAIPTSSSAPGAAGGEGGEGGEGGGLPVTGAAAGTVAGIGGVLLLIGGAIYLIGRRRNSRFVA